MLASGTDPVSFSYSSELDLHKWGVFGQVSRSVLNELVDLSFGFRADANSYSADMNNLLDQFSPQVFCKLQIPS